MAFWNYIKRWSWALPVIVLITYVGIDTYIHVGGTYEVTKQRFAQAPTYSRLPTPDTSSPTEYEFGQRDIILPYTGMDGYHWIMQTQDALAKGEARVRYIDYDNYNGDTQGREVHWSSGFRWWVELLAWIEHAYGAVPMPLCIEDVMPFANTALIVVLFIPLAPFIVRRFGMGAGSMVIIGAAAVLPMYQAFSEGKSDHHGLAALSTMLTLLLLLGGGAGWIRTTDQATAAKQSPFLAWLPDRQQARRWFIAAGIIGGVGLWVSTASEAPVLAEVGLAALVAGGWLGYGVTADDAVKPDPSLWRVWGWAGAASSIFFYLLEYFPSHMEMRLEVNHPFYAAAWAGGGEIIYRVCRWWNGGKLAEKPADWAWLGASVVGVLIAPTLILLMADQVFWVKDRFLFQFHEDYIQEFKDMQRFLDPMYASGSARYLPAILNPLPLLTVPILAWTWRQMRVPVLVVAGLAGPAYLFFRLALFIVPATRAQYPLTYVAVPLLVLFAITGVTIACLLAPKQEKVILLGTLAAGLFLYAYLINSFQGYLATHPDWPLDYAFWPELTVPLVVAACLLMLWDPWPEFPRSAKAMLLLALAPSFITTVLALRETRWMEQGYSLWVATLAGVVVIVGRHTGYRWPRLKWAFWCGFATLALLLGNLMLWRKLAPDSKWIAADWVWAMPWVMGVLVAGVVAGCFGRPDGWPTRARVALGALFLAMVLAVSPAFSIRDWPLLWGAVPLGDTELMELVTRDASQRLRARLGPETGVVVSGPTTTSWMMYWGGFKGLGTLYWENLQGLKNDRDIYAAQTSDEALQLIKKIGVTHIVIYSWDAFYLQYARLAIHQPRPYDPNEYIAEKPLHDWLADEHLMAARDNEIKDERPLLEHTFVYGLIEGARVPPWLRLLYYPMPNLPQLRGNYVVIFEYEPNQTPEEAAVRMAQFCLQSGNLNGATNQLNSALQQRADYLPAYICAAHLYHAQNSPDFSQVMARIRLLLPMGDNNLDLSDRLDLALAFILDHDDASATRELLRCAQTADARSLRRLTPEQQFNLLNCLRQINQTDSRPGLHNFIFEVLFTDLQRAIYLYQDAHAIGSTQPARALAELQRALEWEPGSPAALAELTGLLATAHDPAVRNPAEAVKTGLVLREKAGLENSDAADMLAMAYAANQQFDLAEKTEQEAVQLAQKAKAADQVALFQSHLQAFRNHQFPQ